MALKLPTNPGPNADFYDTLRYLQGVAAYLGEHVTVIEFNQKAHAMATNDFQSAIDRNTAAAQAEVASGVEERRQLADITDRLTKALDDLSTSKAPTQEQLDQLNAVSADLEQATAANQADDTAMIPPSPTPAVDPNADPSSVPSA